MSDREDLIAEGKVRMVYPHPHPHCDVVPEDVAAFEAGGWVRADALESAPQATPDDALADARASLGVAASLAIGIKNAADSIIALDAVLAQATPTDDSEVKGSGNSPQNPDSEPRVVVIHTGDEEQILAAKNEGYDLAMTQTLADDPSAADEWLDAHDREVARRAWDECLDAIEQHELNTDQAREGSPYRTDER